MSDLPTLRHRDEPPAQPTRKRKFSQDSINDLIFWGVHLCIVAIALAIVWYRIDVLSRAIKDLLGAQNREVILMERQVKAVQAQTDLVTSQAAERQAQIEANKLGLTKMVQTVGDIEDSIAEALKQNNAIAQTVLTVSQQTRIAAMQAQTAAKVAADAATGATGAAQSAASAAAGARSAAGAAAGAAGATNSLVRSKVVTSSDKERIRQQEQALTIKKAQLSRTIRQVKKNGPNLFQRLFQ